MKNIKDTQKWRRVGAEGRTQLLSSSRLGSFPFKKLNLSLPFSFFFSLAKYRYENENVNPTKNIKTRWFRTLVSHVSQIPSLPPLLRSFRHPSRRRSHRSRAHRRRPTGPLLVRRYLKYQLVFPCLFLRFFCGLRSFCWFLAVVLWVKFLLLWLLSDMPRFFGSCVRCSVVCRRLANMFVVPMEVENFGRS